MKTFHKTHEGNLRLAEDIELFGLVTGSVTVPSGICLLLYGGISGDLIVEQTAEATVHGTVGGSLINNGGEVQVFGTVGRILDGTGRTRVEPNAVIKNS